MATLEVIIENGIGIAHQLFFLFFMVPYFYLESIYKALFVKVEPKSVKGEIVLITGTGHGMGKLLAIKYAKEGATVVGWDVNEELNKKTIQEIKQMGYQKVYGYKVDVANRENVMSVAEQVKQEIGDVTILINNAGIMPHHSFLEHTEKEIRRIMDINVMGNFWTLQAFLPAMRKNNHGHVVALSSMAGLLGLLNLVPYNASKFAVRGLMEGLHEEFRRYPNNQVKFTTIYPYMVDTGLCTRYEISYPSMSPLLKAEYVVEQIFEAQTKNKRNVSVPADIGFLVKLKTNFWPQSACDYTTDTFKADLLSDLEGQTNGNRG